MKKRIQGILITFVVLAAFCFAGTKLGWFVSNNTAWLLLLLFALCVPVDFLLDWGLDKLGLKADTARLIKFSLVAVVVLVVTTIL